MRLFKNLSINLFISYLLIYLCWDVPLFPSIGLLVGLTAAGIKLVAKY